MAEPANCSNLVQIQNLCQAICSNNSACVGTCLGYLEDEITKQRLSLYRPHKPFKTQETTSILSLGSVLASNAIGHRRFSAGHRLRLAVLLSTNLLQLYRTPWLADTWDHNDIAFLDGIGDDSLKDPFVSCNTNHVNDSSPADNGIPVSAWEDMVLNRSLFALGILLIELCLGKPFEELRDEAMAGKGRVSAASDFAVANQLLDEVMNEFGDRWAYIEASLNDIFTEQNESVDAKTYVQRKMGLYTVIFNYCSRERRPGLYERRDRAAELHGRLDEYLKQHLQGLRNASTEYVTALNRYEKAAQYNSQVFNPVNREYAFLEQDQGKKVHDIYSLHMIRWKEYMGPDPRPVVDGGEHD
ncbi:hypothetical protein DIS24_g1021 [Lasiodiplodia hormozganensis]|uniref:Uncharacterized protein n=1 Tax=Lasiodiplodia hormozganensis TaxID=869390 RepID=A0AA40D877_9PEZI|nr:hypothetical protein DIS24_g1021 [Lasiodiplodia hormozganensis]